MIVIEYTHKELKGKRTGLGTQDFIITLTSNHIIILRITRLVKVTCTKILISHLSIQLD